MAIYDGLDLSRFKRVSTDKKSTKLRHARGHEITIAHSALTPKMREQIAKLKDHGETEPRKSYAEGTDEEPVGPNDGAPQVAAPAQAMDPTSPAQAAPAQPTLAPEAPQQPEQPQPQMTPKPTQMPVAGQVDIVAPEPAQPPKPTPVQMAQQMTQDDLAYQKDLQMGHIKPQTYQDLYAKKDTLGKIGTFFGLLVSGAGSGLAHQPNAVMEMMNKEIERDFEAQQKTQGNAQNWRTLSLQHARDQAQIGLQEAQAINTYGQTQLIPSQMKLNEAQTNLAYKNAELAGAEGAKIKMSLTALQYLQDKVDNLPPGPEKNVQQKFLNDLSSVVQNGAAKKNLQVANQIAARDEMAPQDAPEDEGALDIERLKALSGLVQVGSSTGVPNKQGATQADIDRINTVEAPMLAQNREAHKLWQESFKNLKSKFMSSALNKESYNAQTKVIAGEIAKTLGNTSGQTAEDLQSAMFPSWKDFNGSKGEKFDRGEAFFAANEGKATTAKKLGLLKPFPKGGGKKKYGEGAISKDGNSIVKNGQWTPRNASKQAKK